MIKLPPGKGAFIWQPRLIEGGDPGAAVAAAAGAGFSHVNVKVADGIYPYPAGAADRSLLSDMIIRFKASGIQVWGWVYIYGVDPAKEADIAASRFQELGLDGLLIDAEKELKNKPSSASAYMSRLRSHLPLASIGLCSYRYPVSYHPELPWREFRSLCNFDAPQVYWVGAHNPAEQLLRSIQEFRSLSPQLPYYAVGSAYTASPWKPTPSDWMLFMDACKEQELSGFSFWEWAKTRTYLPEIWETISGYTWEPEPPPPPPPPPDPGDITHTDLLEQLRINYAGIQEIKQLLEGGSPPPPPPPVDEFILVRVSENSGTPPKAVAHTYKERNAKGFPIWIPAGETDNRLVFRDLSVDIEVYADKYQGDGGRYAYKLAPQYSLQDGSIPRWVNTETGDIEGGLYVLQSDVYKSGG